jgi:hypothetical protein
LRSLLPCSESPSYDGDDIRITVYTAEPGTDDAERLALAIILGTQELIIH